MEKVFYGGIELTKYITIAKGFTLFDGADFDPQFGDYSTSDGSGFLFTRKGVKKISLPFYNKTGTF